MEATEGLRAALERCVKSLKDQKMISVHCRPHSKVVDLIMQELASLGSEGLGESRTVTGRSVDPLTVVSMIARGEVPPEPERVVSMSKMAEHYARHARSMDGENPEFEHVNYKYPDFIYLRRLAWKMQRAFGVVIFQNTNLIMFFGPSNSIKTCKMTMDLLIEQIKEELALLASDDEREQFCQKFGEELKLPDIITDDENKRLHDWAESKAGKVNIVGHVAVDEKIASRASELAKRVAI
jgi:hypothetical protein